MINERPVFFNFSTLIPKFLMVSLLSVTSCKTQNSNNRPSAIPDDNFQFGINVEKPNSCYIKLTSSKFNGLNQGNIKNFITNISEVNGRLQIVVKSPSNQQFSSSGEVDFRKYVIRTVIPVTDIKSCNVISFGVYNNKGIGLFDSKSNILNK
jgi:hypothetical protein